MKIGYAIYTLIGEISTCDNMKRMYEYEPETVTYWNQRKYLMQRGIDRLHGKKNRHPMNEIIDVLHKEISNIKYEMGKWDDYGKKHYPDAWNKRLNRIDQLNEAIKILKNGN